MWTLQQSGSWDLARVAICWERIYAPSCCLVRFCAVVLLPIPWSIFEGYSTARKKKKCSTLCLVPSHAVQSEPPSNVFQPGGASTWGAGLSSVLLIEIELFWRARSFTIIPALPKVPYLSITLLLRFLERGRFNQYLRRKCACLYMRAHEFSGPSLGIGRHISYHGSRRTAATGA